MLPRPLTRRVILVRDYHVYKDTWATAFGEELPRQREDGNRADFFAVAVVRGEAIVGHDPKRIYHPFALSIYTGEAQSFVE